MQGGSRRWPLISQEALEEIRRASQHPPDASSESKSFKDFIVYLKAGFTIEYCISKVVADYRLWRKEDKTPFEADLLVQYHKLLSRGDRHIYL